MTDGGRPGADLDSDLPVLDRFVLSPAGLGSLIDRLRADGWTTLGPVARDGAIGIDEIRGLADLPAGVDERQIPGGYRVEHREHGLFFAFTVGPQSYKRSFFPPRLRLFRLRRAGAGFVDEEDALAPPPRLALIGARSSDLHAIEIQDRVFLGGPFVALAAMPLDRATHRVEHAVRNHDPCISRATRFLELRIDHE